MIYCFGPVSGGHLNPAVTFAMKCQDDSAISWQQAGIYMATQLFGGICGALSYWYLMGDTVPLAPMNSFVWWHAMVIEFLYTFMLALVVVNITHKDNDQREDYGLAIGFVVVAGGYAGGWISGGCFNPAVAFGIDLSSAGHTGFGYCLLYWVPQMLAGACAGILTKTLRPKTGDLTMNAVVEMIGTFFLVLTVPVNVGGANVVRLMIQETLFTFVLCSTVLSVATAAGTSLRTMFSLAIGFCVVVGGYACKISGGHLNPAVSIALDTTSSLAGGNGMWGSCLWYALAQCIGGGLSAGVFMATHPMEYSKGFKKMEIGSSQI